MKRLSIVLLCLALICMTVNTTFSQVHELIYGTSEPDYANKIIQTFDGNFIIAGAVNGDYWENTTNACLIKVTPQGQVLWVNTYDANSDLDWFSDLIQAEDSALVVTGHCKNCGANREKLYLVKTNKEGNLIWSITNGGTDLTQSHGICLSSDSNYVVTGSSTDTDAWLDVILVKFDTNGTQIWKKYYARSFDDTGHDVKLTSDGGFIIAGRTGLWSASPVAWIIKTDSLGTMQWNKVFGDTTGGNGYCSNCNWEWANAIEVLPSGDFIITGRNYDTSSDFNLWLFKISATGQLLWERFYGGNGYDEGMDVKLLPSGGFLVSGQTTLPDGNNQAWVLFTDAMGLLDTSYVFGGALSDKSNSIVDLGNETFAFAGWTNSCGSGDKDIWYVHYIESGSVTLTPSDDSVCQGDTVCITASVSNGGTDPTLRWFVNGNLQNGLVGYYPFNGNVQDQSGNGLHGIVNGATLTTDRFGNPESAYYFNGTSDNIEVADNPLLRFSSSFTISLWVMLDNPYIMNTNVTPLAKPWGSEWKDSYVIYSGVWGGGDTMTNAGYWNSVTGEDILSIFPLQMNTWHNISWVMDRTIDTGYLYIDGTLMANKLNSVGTPFYDSHPLLFGSDLSAGIPAEFFPGKIDDIRLYSRSLSSQEVQAIYFEGDSTFCFVPVAGDTVYSVLSYIDSCGTILSDTSNYITIAVQPIQPVSILIAASENPVNAGTSVTFTAYPTNQGTNPVYQWKVNGNNAGTDSVQFTYVPANGDTITCVMTSNVSCPINNPASSNQITMVVITPCPGIPTVNYNGKTYNTVQIGNQCWLRENLNVGIMINNSQDQTDNGIIEKYCYENNNGNCDTYGGLYQWGEIMEYISVPGTNGICPDEWHIPTDEEFKILEGNVDSQYGVGDPEWDKVGYRGFDAGKNLKSTFDWSSNGNGLNSFGFTCLPGGMWYEVGIQFRYLHENGIIWSSSEDVNNMAWRRLFNYESDSSDRARGPFLDAFSVRCIRDTCTSFTSASILISVSNDTVCQGDTVCFTAISTNTGPTPTYQWYINGTIQDGLMAWYPFNGNANDESGNGNNGVVNGATLTTNRFGYENSAYIFDGIDDYIVVPNSSSLNFTEQITVSYWIKLETSAPYNWPYYIIEKYGSWGGGQREWDINFVIEPAGDSAVWCTNLVPNIYYYFTMTFNGTVLNLYRDGVLIASESYIGTIQQTTSDIMIGQYLLGGNYFLDGTVDDIRIYNRALNPYEILELYHEGDTSLCYVPSNNDTVYCILTSSDNCAVNNPDTSNLIVMTVHPVLPVSITISAADTTTCENHPVDLTASPVNGGTSPVYQWLVNGLDSGSNATSFSYFPAASDTIVCKLVSSEYCPDPDTALSNTITIDLFPNPGVSYTPCIPITSRDAKPYPLRGGIPLGGTYSGTGVHAGIFYPYQVPVGQTSVSINYFYNNTFNCFDSITQLLTVFPTSNNTCGNLFTDVRDNRTYATILFGGTCWMAQNLNYGTHISAIQYQQDNCQPEKYCYMEATANCTNFGGLYQWDELMQYSDTDTVQGLCPPGWYIPTETDWQALITLFQDPAHAGTPLKSTGLSGFNGLLKGFLVNPLVYKYGANDTVLNSTLYWTSTISSPRKVWAHGLNTVLAEPTYTTSVSSYPSNPANAFSVRCVRDW